MAISRRELIAGGFTAAAMGAALIKPSPALANGKTKPVWTKPALEPGEPGKHYQPVITPNGASLPFKIVEGAKVFHLIAEEVEHEFVPGLKAKCWGFNGRVHGPTIEVVEGDHCRIYVTNNLPSSTAIHWHALLIPNGMDGIGGLTQKPIEPGETFLYEFTLHQHGTFMYHSHHNEMVQIALGLMGLFIIHPREGAIKVDRDYAILLSEWRIEAGASRPNPMEMTDFNVFTFNARSFPGTESLLAKTGDRVRIRIANLSPTDHHPIHIHGHHFKVVATDGGDIPQTAQWSESTVLVPVGSSRTVEFVADNPGDWFLHCHMTHHMMNQMGHNIPNLIGVDPGVLDKAVQPLIPGYMTMSGDAEGMMEGMPVPPNTAAMLGGTGQFGAITTGGMATVVKVRDEFTEGKDPGWYKHPERPSDKAVSPDQLNRDGVNPPKRNLKPGPGKHQH